MGGRIRAGVHALAYEVYGAIGEEIRIINEGKHTQQLLLKRTGVSLMAVPQETIWEIDPHTQAKHEILRRYLGAWFPILSRFNGRIVYIDGFSGPGRYKGGEPGSPLVALNVALTHRERLEGEVTFLFIDGRPDRIEHLERELATLSLPSHFSISAETGIFHEKLGAIIDYLEENNLQLAPTFAFIDPFGFRGIPFSLVERLLRHSKTEAFITFMVDSINRFVEHPNDQVVQHIVDAFGTTEVVDIVCEPGGRVGALRMLYQRQLERIAKFVRYFEMRNADNRTIYYLFFATNHPLGHAKMKEAFWRIDATGRFRFSDATNPGQLVLFELDPSNTLAETLGQKYVRQTVTVEQIELFIVNQTPFLGKHMRSALKILESNRQITVRPWRADGNKRRAGTFPKEVVVAFQGVP